MKVNVEEVDKPLLVFYGGIMNKIKKIFSSLLYILLVLLINFGLIVLFTVFFNQGTSLKINSSEYVETLSGFLINNQLIMVLLSCLLCCAFLLPNLKKQKGIFNTRGLNKIGYLILIGADISLIWNIALYDFGLLSVPKLPTITVLLATAILGPILEELLFRGVIHYKLQSVFSKRVTLILVSLLFAFYHMNVLQGLYAFLFSLVITIMYQKYKNLLVPIIVHCVGNLASAIILPIVLQSHFWVVQFLLILFILVIILSYQLCKEQDIFDHNKNINS